MRRIVNIEINGEGVNTALEKLLREIGFSVEESKFIAVVSRKESRSRSNAEKKLCVLSLTEEKKFLQNFVKKELKRLK